MILMGPTKRDFEWVYSPEELRSRVDDLKSLGYSESDIHILVEDSAVLGISENLDGIHTHNASSIGSKFKSLFTGRDRVREELKKLELEQHEIDHYQKDLERGGILLYTERSSLSRERDNFSSFGDDTRTLDKDEVKRNTALQPFGNGIDRDGTMHHDENLVDKHIKPNYEDSSRRDFGEIYTSTVSRDEQYGTPHYENKFQDSRLKGETIHPTTDRPTIDESAPSEKLMEHEPGTGIGNGNSKIEDGNNRSQEVQSPGADPNLGPAPFGSDADEEQLLTGENGVNEETLNSDGTRRVHDDEDHRPDAPPTPRLF